MTLVAILALSLTALVLTLVVSGLVRLVATDGAHASRPAPPRSHPADLFEPHRFA